MTTSSYTMRSCWFYWHW